MRLVKALGFFLLRHRGISLLALSSLGVAAFFLTRVIIPAYSEPSTRTYNSRLGYPALLRKLGQPLPVSTARSETRTYRRTLLGEGLMASEPILVPLIPIDRIDSVKVEVGDRVEAGQLLAELNDTKLQIKRSSAQLAVRTALAELERVRIGSAYVLAQERPKKDQIDAEAAEKEYNLLGQRVKMYERLHASGGISENDLIEARLLQARAEQDLQQAKFRLSMSSDGVRQSVSIAENAVSEAENALRQREVELRDYKVVAPASGTIERVLIHEGEYNQTPGKPGFVIASGLWFEAHLDQSAINMVRTGDEAEVLLEAHPGLALAGRIERIIPVVSFNSGGPESTRPIRPLGTGAPEWPSTFVVRIRIEQRPEASLVPGLTGFARVFTRQDGICVPRAAVLSLNAGVGLVHVIREGEREVRTVRCAEADAGWLRILTGLAAGEEVVVAGQDVLQPGDRMRVAAKNPAERRK